MSNKKKSVFSDNEIQALDSGLESAPNETLDLTLTSKKAKIDNHLSNAETLNTGIELAPNDTLNLTLTPKRAKKNHNAYSLSFKMEVIAEAEKSSNRHAGRLYKIDESCIRHWRKEKEKLQEATNDVSMQKRCRLGYKDHLKDEELGYKGRLKDEELDGQVFQWIQSLREQNLHVTRKMMKEKIVLLAQQKGIDYKGSDGWCAHFIKRHNLKVSSQGISAKSEDEQVITLKSEIEDDSGAFDEDEAEGSYSIHKTEHVDIVIKDEPLDSWEIGNFDNPSITENLNLTFTPKSAEKNNKAHSIHLKMEVIAEAEKSSNRKAGRKYNIDESCIRRWRKEKEKLEEATNDASMQKRCRLGYKGRLKDEELDGQVFQWIQSLREQNLQVTRKMMKEKIVLLAQQKGIDYKGSDGWCAYFIKRHNLKVSSQGISAKSVDEQVITLKSEINEESFSTTSHDESKQSHLDVPGAFDCDKEDGSKTSVKTEHDDIEIKNEPLGVFDEEESEGSRNVYETEHVDVVIKCEPWDVS